MPATSSDGNIAALVRSALDEQSANEVLDALAIDPQLLAERNPAISRGAFAMALNILLFHGLLQRVPTAAAYVAEVRTRGQQVVFDHGALRTILLPHGPTGALPGGEDAFTRIFQPLGYEMAATYPLHRLKMTGRAYRHRDAPESIPQFFLSELHVDRFDAEFGEAASRIFGSSRDPLNAVSGKLLDCYSAGLPVSLGLATAALPVLVGAFNRQHEPAVLADYDLLLSRSPEAAWIATEGNAFNHATDRVIDVETLARQLREENWPIKNEVEVSRTGRVRQTAFRADMVDRLFANNEMRRVPGSFYEFISRGIDPATGRIDLSFDAGNATGIFAMTSTRGTRVP